MKALNPCALFLQNEQKIFILREGLEFMRYFAKIFLNYF